MVEQKLIGSATAAGTPRHQIWLKVLPAAVPSILTGCRIGPVISCIVVFLAEIITSTEGLLNALPQFTTMIDSDDQLDFFYKHGLGYAQEMAGRPQTLYALAESPAGLAAWMLDHDAREPGADHTRVRRAV